MKFFGVDFSIQGFADLISPSSPSIPTVSVYDLNPAAFGGQQSTDPFQNSIYDGGKFSGGFGATQLQWVDYWTLRMRSRQLFTENLYAKGLIRRLITNEINTGLTPESSPDEEIIGVEEDSLSNWTETVENRFGLWGKSPQVCDFKRVSTFGAIQAQARLEALISGDVLVVLRQSRRTKLPSVQLISGNSVRSPLGGQGTIRGGHTVRQGVEFDSRDRVVAYWITQKDRTVKRLPAFGEKSGRRIAWLVFGTEKLLDDVRGQPLLSIVLQSLKEIDRYRDSVQRKAVINSIMAMFIKKDVDKAGTMPLSAMAVRKDSATITDSDGTPRNFDIAKYLPGAFIGELQVGEEPILLGKGGTDTDFGTFESAILEGIAWAHEMPPEILKLGFSNNYSASQAAINEFKIYLNKFWVGWGDTFCAFTYTEWLISEVLLQKISAPGLLEAWRNPQMHDVFAAWTCTQWYGSIKPSTDMLKQAKGSQLLVDNGWSTNAREARGATGTKFSKNIKRLRRENLEKAEAMEPIIKMRERLKASAPSGGGNSEALDASEIEAILDDYLEEKGVGNVG